MKLKLKTKEFELIEFAQNGEALQIVLKKENHSTDEIIDVFMSAEETQKIVVVQDGTEKAYEGFTEFSFANVQETSQKEGDDLKAIIGLKKPDLTVDRLKAALLHLSIATNNMEITEGIDV